MKHSAFACVAWVVAFCLVGLLGGCASSNPKPTNPSGPARVLFIGNSYTAYHGTIPAILNIMAPEKLDCVGNLSGGKTLQWHWEEGTARESIAEGGWDFVVIQDHSMQPINKPEEFVEYTRRFDEAIDRVGAKTVLYMTWPRQHQPENGPIVYGAYSKAAEELNATLAPVGLAWKRSIEKHPDLALYMEDKSHPTPAGTYMAACVFYATLLERSPVGLPEKIVNEEGKVLVELSPEDARFLQRIASEHALTSATR